MLNGTVSTELPFHHLLGSSHLAKMPGGFIQHAFPLLGDMGGEISVTFLGADLKVTCRNIIAGKKKNKTKHQLYYFAELVPGLHVPGKKSERKGRRGGKELD